MFVLQVRPSCVCVAGEAVMERRIRMCHVAQTHSWDCGLASAQMVLKYALVVMFT